MPFKQFHPVREPKHSFLWNDTGVLTPIFPDLRPRDTATPSVFK